jgi:hypothetical protein
MGGEERRRCSMEEGWHKGWGDNAGGVHAQRTQGAQRGAHAVAGALMQREGRRDRGIDAAQRTGEAQTETGVQTQRSEARGVTAEPRGTGIDAGRGCSGANAGGGGGGALVA